MLTTDAVLTELRRELATRQRVYPGWVRAGKLHSATADLRVAALQQAIQMIEQSQPQQGGLFDE